MPQGLEIGSLGYLARTKLFAGIYFRVRETHPLSIFPAPQASVPKEGDKRC
jgi:hypothetical protein